MRFAVVLLVAAVATGCTAEPPTPAAHHSEEKAPELHEGRGTILFFEEGRVYLNHEEMPGFMDAMAMGFDYHDPALVEGLSPGMTVVFRVVVEGEHFYLDQMTPE